ncbi:MAG: DUF2807 domain-containing protein [Proteobacteria bacterium]|nr:DUF2807 domain-containing protein [Pseudomonadota bacterium]
MNKTLTAITLAAGALLAAGIAMTALAAGTDEHGTWTGGRDMIAGSGHVQTEARNVGSFRAIESHGSMNVVVRQGARVAVEVRADDNLLPLVETSVVDRNGVPTLQIDTRAHASYHTRNDIVVTVDAVALQAIGSNGSGDIQVDALKTPALKLDMRGSGDVRLKQLDTDDFTVRVAGSSDVQAAGRAGKVTLSIAGSGDIDTAKLEADDVQVKIAGSGDASVNAHRTLGVAIAGSGDVTYVGDATVKSSIAGSGSVSKR